MEQNIVIKIKNLTKRFPVGGDYFTALQDVDLTLNEGEFTGLVGPVSYTHLTLPTKA